MRKALSFSLSALLALSLLAGPSVKPDPKFKKKLSKDLLAVHALDRLTFGPRPGDLEKVERMGVKKWVDLQLHPEQIPENPVLAERLLPLESLTMSSAEIAKRYPAPQMIKAIAMGRLPMPTDPVTRAAVERLLEKYRNKKGNQEAKQDAQVLDGKNGAAATTATPNDIADLEPRRPMEEILNPAEIKTLRSGTPDQKKQLLATMPANELDDLVIALPKPMRQQLFNFAPVAVRRKVLLMNAPQQVVAYDLLDSKLLRAVYSNRQLGEEMTDFWYNHFNVYLDKGADRYLVPSFERDAIRPHILGKFRDLLQATAESPAMLFYLDNWESVANKPETANAKRPKQGRRGLNENYARELLELHTLGVEGGYTQKDIIEVARCFTGWTIQAPRLGGGFYFNEKVHDKGEKVVLGVTIPAGGGQDDGFKVLDILVHHPSTARFLSRKLAMRFVSDTPPPALIDQMAKTFSKTDGDIRQVMKTMLTSKEFWSEGAYRAKVKTPLETVASAVRAIGANVDSGWNLANQIAQLGQPLYRKQEPTGYSSANAEWVNSAALLARMNFALALAQNKLPGVTAPATTLTDPRAIAESLLFTTPTEQTQQAIEKGATPAMVAGLVLGSPDFQRR